MKEPKMAQKSLLSTFIAGVTSIALPAYVQSEESGRQDAAVQAFGRFVTTATQNGIDNNV
jgi:hypothetical protein